MTIFTHTLAALAGLSLGLHITAYVWLPISAEALEDARWANYWASCELHDCWEE